ncbi:MAG: cytochrome c5 [Phenylobacterium sp.]|jgi:cytochrome c5
MNKALFSIASIAFLTASLSVANAGESQSDEDIIKRIQPIGEVHLAGDAPAVAAGPRSGEDVFKASCFACHGTGAMGAPKPGDSGEWTKRLAQGMDVVVQHAITGFSTMPARGTCGNCSDDELKAAVEFMVK